MYLCLLADIAIPVRELIRSILRMEVRGGNEVAMTL
jgi:hypothetical protein